MSAWTQIALLGKGSIGLQVYPKL